MPRVTTGGDAVPLICQALSDRGLGDRTEIRFLLPWMGNTVDVLFSFSIPPKAVFQTSGRDVVHGLLSASMPAFSKIMVSDIEGMYRR